MKIIITKDFKWIKADTVMECTKAVGLAMIRRGVAAEVVGEYEAVGTGVEVENDEGENSTPETKSDTSPHVTVPTPAKRRGRPRKHKNQENISG